MLRFSSALVLAAVCASLVAAKPPNFLLLYADDMGWGDLQCYGHPTISTPNLDKMAAEGMRFTQLYSAHPLCTPSRMALLSGRYATRSGMVCGWLGGVLTAMAGGGIPDDEVTLAELLSGKGYATHMSGKWHLGQLPQYLPTEHGFDSYLGIPFSNDMGSSVWKSPSLCSRLDPYCPFPLPLLNGTKEDGVSIIAQPADLSTVTQNYTDRSISFMQQQVAADKPFFLYHAYHHAHIPEFCSMSYCNTSSRGVYGDSVSEMDGSVGQILGALADLGVDDNTFTFFASDNGPWLIQDVNAGSAGLLYGGKASTWEGGVREPGIFRWPGRIPAGTVSRALATTMDYYVTAAALAGAALPDYPMDGMDLSSVLFANATSARERAWGGVGEVQADGMVAGTRSSSADGPRQLYYYHRGQNQTEGNATLPGLWAVRYGAYKGHFWTKSGFGPDEPVFHDPPLLFNLDHDPGEHYPLNTSLPEYAAIVEEIYHYRAVHESTFGPEPANQCANNSIAYSLCCDPNSTEKYPTLPNCTCSPENWVDPYGGGGSMGAQLTYDYKAERGWLPEA